MDEHSHLDVIDVSTEAVGSIISKSFLCIGVLFLGSTFGGYTGGERSFDSLRHGFFWTIEIAVESMITTKGFVLLPLIFLTFYFFLRYRISRWLLIVPMILFWILSHDYISSVYEWYEKEGILHELE